MNRTHIMRREFFDKHSQGWDEEETPEKIETLYQIFGGLGMELNGYILDAGCGTGILVPIIHKLAQENLKLVELDFSAAMLRRNQARHPKFLSSTFMLGADAQALPFGQPVFDAIICFSVLPHFLDKQKAIGEFFRVLQPGGRLLILHLTGSKQLNHFHRDAGEAVAEDRLSPVPLVANNIREEGFTIVETEERDDLYLILAQK